MKKATTFVTALALAAAMAAPVAANNVPLNNVSGGEGQELVKGQAGFTVGAGLVAGLAVLAVVAASDSSSSTVEE